MGEEELFKKYLADNEVSNERLLAKYKAGQKVRVDLGDGETITATIEEIYPDYNGGPIQDIFVDIVDDNGDVIDRILADRILEIVEDVPTRDDDLGDKNQTDEIDSSDDGKDYEGPPF